MPAALIPQIVGWCRSCECVHIPYRAGEKCPCDAGMKVVKRRMVRCRACGGYYPSWRALAEHEHYDWE